MTEPITAESVASKILEPWKEATTKDEFGHSYDGFGYGCVLNAESDIEELATQEFNKGIELAMELLNKYALNLVYITENAGLSINDAVVSEASVITRLHGLVDSINELKRKDAP